MKQVIKVQQVLMVIKVQRENHPQSQVIRVIKEIKVLQVQEQKERRVLDHLLQLELVHLPHQLLLLVICGGIVTMQTFTFITTMVIVLSGFQSHHPLH